MKTNTFDCVQYQRKIRDEFFNEADGDIKRLWILLKEKSEKSDFIKLFKEKNKIK
jgi:hypothetical protein